MGTKGEKKLLLSLLLYGIQTLIIFTYWYFCVYMCVYVHMCEYLQSPEEELGPLRARVIGTCEPASVSPRNQSLVLW